MNLNNLTSPDSLPVLGGLIAAIALIISLATGLTVGQAGSSDSGQDDVANGNNTVIDIPADQWQD